MQKQTFAGVMRFFLGQVGYVRQGSLILALSLMFCVGLVGTAHATTTSTSTHYGVTETQFGPGSALHDCSSNYCSKIAAGDTAVGRTSSPSYAALVGSNTTDQPFLAVVVTGGTQNMGVLDASTTGTATDGINVLTYMSSGYVMQIVGSAPSQGTHTLRVPLGQPGNTPFTSQQGAEQFGINLVANTAPALGANPIKQPAGTAITSVITSNYSTPNEFAYTDGDIVAQSTNGMGEIDYTLSMIINVSDVTPGGRYSGTYAAVVTPTF